MDYGWAILILNNYDTLVLCFGVDHCSRVLLLALGLAGEQSHYSRDSDCRGMALADWGKAVTPHRPQPHSHRQWSCPPQHKARPPNLQLGSGLSNLTTAPSPPPPYTHTTVTSLTITNWEIKWLSHNQSCLRTPIPWSSQSYLNLVVPTSNNIRSK